DWSVGGGPVPREWPADRSTDKLLELGARYSQQATDTDDRDAIDTAGGEEPFGEEVCRRSSDAKHHRRLIDRQEVGRTVLRMFTYTSNSQRCDKYHAGSSEATSKKKDLSRR